MDDKTNANILPDHFKCAHSFIELFSESRAISCAHASHSPSIKEKLYALYAA